MFIPLGVWGTERLGVPGRLPLTDSLLISLALLMELAPRCRCAGMPLTAVLTPPIPPAIPSMPFKDLTLPRSLPPMLGVPGCTPPTTLQSHAPKQGRGSGDGDNIYIYICTHTYIYIYIVFVERESMPAMLDAQLTAYIELEHSKHLV